ncbi:hypothetical protein ISS37_02885 [candidate division KSB1 bacterium]|nr:hypothetical protein [candidate division KSB1 bacterium]
MIPFSQRHREAIDNKKLTVFISKRVKQKIVYCMQNYNIHYELEPEGSFNPIECSIFYDDLKRSLIENYGVASLKVYVDDVFQETEDVKQFILGTKHEYVLDAIELYITLISEPDKALDFQKECNQIFKSENSPLRILDGFIIKLDSDFLESEILNKAFELLENNYFEKACRDFLNARNKFTAGDYSGTIMEANNAIESTLKKVLYKDRGEQGNLKKWLMKSGIIPDYFQGFCDHFKGLLQAAFTIANESSRHGKKEIPDKKNEVDRAVASFFLHLTGSLIVFIMERYQEKLPEPEMERHKENLPEPEEDLPF